MKCYDCAGHEKSTDAVGICVLCGRAVCIEHSHLQHFPQHFAAETGMATQFAQCEHDRPRLVCGECKAATECCDGATVDAR